MTPIYQLSFMMTDRILSNVSSIEWYGPLFWAEEVGGTEDKKEKALIENPTKCMLLLQTT